ncbi:MAG: polysaccharide deacetylase family protein [Bacteroidetes bacterium]|nr:polysaccharide deacetylase family protein [Bacteroidota bacterium]
MIFKSILGIDYEITTNRDSFKQFEGAKISYTQKQIENELFLQSETLLFEEGIQTSPLAPLLKERGIENSKDIFSLSFFLVTRYEEYLPFIGDKYRRFSAKQSFAYKNNFLQKPVVNIWAQKIRGMISERYPDFIFPEKKYSYTPTIDIDNAYAYRGKSFARTIGGFARALSKSDLDDFFRRKNVLSGKEKDPYDTYDFQIDVHKKYGLNPIYFFLLGDWAANDKNVSHTNHWMRSLIKDISQNIDTGIHPSFASNQYVEKVKIEKERLEKIKNDHVTKSRQHFLMLRFPHTYRNLIASGITDDYTMGFADEIGFRAGICTPYKFYDLEKEEETNLTIHPFAVMDGTLNNYLKLAPQQALEKIKEVVREVKNVNGELITVWHNETLSDWREWKGWKEVYEEVIKIATSP